MYFMKTKKCTRNNREKKQMEKDMFNYLHLRSSYLDITYVIIVYQFFITYFMKMPLSRLQ